MTDFAVVRHPEAGIGVIPAAALEMHQAKGWVRVSEYHPEPDFYLPDFAESTQDLDAPEPEEPHVHEPDEPDEDEETAA